MFVQVIEARTADPDGLGKQFEKWQSDLSQGASGFVGSTGGVTEDRQVIVCARFESEEAAMRNSERAEQGAWWTETQKYLLGTPNFRNTTDVIVHGNPSDDAGFVQVMRGRASDPRRAKEIDRELAESIPDFRSDVLGSMTAWFGNDFVGVVYFRSEGEARDAEKKEPPDELKSVLAEYDSVVEDIEYLDLRDPWVRSP